MRNLAPHIRALTRLHPRVALLLVGLSLLGCSVVLRTWSASLTAAYVAGAERTYALVAILVAMGGLYLWATRLIPRLRASDDKRLLLMACVLIGLLMRVSQWAAAPIYENDYLRYLWDGAVLSSGVDPYRSTPASIGTRRLLCSLRRGPAPAAGDPDDCVLSDLADRSGDLVDRIGYGDVTTIYPPVAQLAFAAAYRIQPFSLEAWRGVLLCAEWLSVCALIGILLAVREDPLWALVYWWNPLVIVHVANGAHIEALLVPFLVLALWAVSRQRLLVAALAIALAAAIKIWPLLLLPSLMSASPDKRLNRRATVLGLVTAGLLLSPQLSKLGPDAGVAAFATEWVRNALAFPCLRSAWSVFFPQAADADRAARATVLLVVLLISLRGIVAGPTDLRSWARRWALCIAALFLLAPTGYPWYFIGVLPFLCFWRALPLLILPITLPLYFSLYIVRSLDNGPAISTILVTAEFLPVWAGLAWMAWRRVRATTLERRPAAPGAADAGNEDG